MENATKLQIWIDVQSARRFRALAALNGLTLGEQLEALIAESADKKVSVGGLSRGNHD